MNLSSACEPFVHLSTIMCGLWGPYRLLTCQFGLFHIFYPYEPRGPYKLVEGGFEPVTYNFSSVTAFRRVGQGPGTVTI